MTLDSWIVFFESQLSIAVQFHVFPSGIDVANET